MDVFEKEPPDRDNPVFTLNDRVVVTPHMAGLSTESKMTMFELSTQNLLDVLAGRRPDSVLNPKVYKKRGK
jgi:D-3-phosphoglycerate dehydrogenase